MGIQYESVYSLVQNIIKVLSGGNNDAITGATYKVVKGDTLYSISKRSGVTIDNIKNGIT